MELSNGNGGHGISGTLELLYELIWFGIVICERLQLVKLKDSRAGKQAGRQADWQARWHTRCNPSVAAPCYSGRTRILATNTLLQSACYCRYCKAENSNTTVTAYYTEFANNVLIG